MVRNCVKARSSVQKKLYRIDMLLSSWGSWFCFGFGCHLPATFSMNKCFQMSCASKSGLM